MATGVHHRRDTEVRTKLALTGVATAGLLTAGLSIATPAYAASVPADCTVQYQEFSVSMTCTARPATQVWNLEALCQVLVAAGLRLPVQGSEVTGDGTSNSGSCPNPSDVTFVVDS
jgi:hypothetical protein